MNGWEQEFADQCERCQCGTCADLGHLLCASVGCVNHYTAPYEAIRAVRDWHINHAHGLERARCIAELEALIEKSTWVNYVGRFSPPVNAGLRQAIAALKSNDASSSVPSVGGGT